MLPPPQHNPILPKTLISSKRLSSYQNVFRPANDIELIGVYLWNTHVCGALYPLIHMAEITLRNAIDQALVAELGTFWWSGTRLRHRSYTHEAATPRTVQALRGNFIKATRKYIDEIRSRHRTQGHIAPNHDGVLAKTELSTWEFLLDAEFMGRGLIWPKHMPSVFRGPWPAPRASTVLGHARNLVATLRHFRNRLFHHEPAWKRYGVHTEADALEHLRDKVSRIEALLALIHPDNPQGLQKNGLLQAAHRACTANEIRRFQNLVHIHDIHSLNTLDELVDHCILTNCVLKAKLPRRRSQQFFILPS
ncbi:CAAX protease [Candidimonas nitroreducens]|uniref:CAAX protease n=1 Tax=Candidimonas nitroreducens TaxID=683354 RepID=A0A225MR48_9BURK|nr:CAAX protease [Candidimonas nitroreducens]OWT63726.1 CAAX protease [Candidimonas nitroreducens]